VRILHVVGERGYSGGEVQLAFVLERLRAEGHEQRLVLQPGAAFAEEAARLGLTTVEVAMRGALHVAAARRIRRARRAFDPDLVHLADARAHALGAWAGLPGGRPPTVVSRRVARPLRRDPWHRWLYGRAVDAVVAVSEAVAACVRALGVPAERVHVIHDGVDLACFAPGRLDRAAAREALDLPADALVVASAARLDPRKGQDTLLRAFASLAVSRPAAHLVLAGEGPERARLEALARELGVAERARLPGALDTAELLAAADVACVPSLREGLSVFALEAQAAGRPVVASRVGGLPEAVADGVSGLLVEPADAAALATALGALLDDAARRDDLGRAGRTRAEREFGAARMAERTAALYARVAATRS
jgi:glycosyltransferase involved in cell wall biosynthesis